MSEPATEGWWNPRPFSSVSKFHYVHEGRSLCLKWGRLFGQGALETGNDDHPDNCKECRRRLLKWKGGAK